MLALSRLDFNNNRKLLEQIQNLMRLFVAPPKTLYIFGGESESNKVDARVPFQLEMKIIRMAMCFEIS